MIALAGEIIGLGLIIFGYLLGSVPSTFIIGKIFFGIDIRNQGSGNVGGANAIRLFGKKAGLFGGLLDILKGTFVILICRFVLSDQDIDSSFLSKDLVIATAGFFAIFGHCFSLYLKFSGGKGGATTAGVILALDYFSFIILVLFWLIVVGSTRFTSLGNLLSVITVPLFLDYRIEDNSYFYLGVAITLLIYFKHRANVIRLLTGEERKFGDKETIV